MIWCFYSRGTHITNPHSHWLYKTCTGFTEPQLPAPGSDWVHAYSRWRESRFRYNEIRSRSHSHRSGRSRPSVCECAMCPIAHYIHDDTVDVINEPSRIVCVGRPPACAHFTARVGCSRRSDRGQHYNLTCRWSVAAAMTSTSPSMSMLLLESW